VTDNHVTEQGAVTIGDEGGCGLKRQAGAVGYLFSFCHSNKSIIGGFNGTTLAICV